MNYLTNSMQNVQKPYFLQKGSTTSNSGLGSQHCTDSKPVHINYTMTYDIQNIEYKIIIYKIAIS